MSDCTPRSHYPPCSCIATNQPQTWYTYARASGLQMLQISAPHVPIGTSSTSGCESFFKTDQIKSKFSKGHFSTVSTYFSILSSRKGQTHFEITQNPQNFKIFDINLIQNFDPKSEKCDFINFFYLEKSSQNVLKKKS